MSSFAGGSVSGWPESDESTLLALASVLQSRRWAIASPPQGRSSAIEQAELELAAKFGRRFAVTTCNGSAAIVIALQALGIGPGARVLVPALTWVACASAVRRVGATPIFADSSETSILADGGSISGAHLDAILAVHTYASAQSLGCLKSRFPGVPIVEDFSHVHGGTTDDGSLIGSQGVISVCSFQSSKMLTCGEGGAAFTNDPDLAAAMAALRADSRVRGSGDSLVAHPTVRGANYALSEISAALLRDQMRRLDDQCRRRAAGADAFVQAAKVRGLEIAADQALLAAGAFYRLPIRLNSAMERDALFQKIKGDVETLTGVGLEAPYPIVPASPLYRHPADHAVAAFPWARAWSECTLVFPHEMFLGCPDMLQRLAEAIAGKGTAPRVRGGPTRAEAVTVAIVTKGERGDLARAIQSVEQQDYGGSIELLILGDDVEVRPPDFVRSRVGAVRSVRISVSEETNRHWVGRVAQLRNLAASLATTPLIAFLDDDNRWESDHLSSLVSVMSRAGALAAHSWRRLEEADGRPWSGRDFPWRSESEAATAIWRKLNEAGLIVPGDDRIRERMILGDGVGMVDLGAWLFRAEALRSAPFAIEYDAEEISAMVGEDDKWLARIVEQGLAMPCTEQATLVYTLGGRSNATRAPPCNPSSLAAQQEGRRDDFDPGRTAGPSGSQTIGQEL